MFSTLATILKDNWQWRKQIVRLSVYELMKKARGSVLGWAWLAIKPAMYIFVFWFALDVGLRAGHATAGDYPYFLWLISGLVPWFYMSDMIGTGCDVLHRYPYLVNKVKFPLSGISSLFSISTLFVNLILFVILIAFYIGYGMPFDIYLIQIPIIYALMLAFWNAVSIFISQLSGISKDIGQLMKAVQQPFFWLSGVIFDMSILAGTGFEWASNVMLFNPVTFFCTAFRDALCDKVWFWQDPVFFGAFLIMLVGTIVLMAITYKHFNEEVSDAL